MLNWLHYLTHRPEKGWDPIPETHARTYNAEESAFDEPRKALVSEIERRIGGLAGKTVLDLGGGPGHYAAEFARRGAAVTWVDVSALYAAIAKANCDRLGVQVDFKLSYMDDVWRLGRTFDLVFSRICWNYAYDEPKLARHVGDILKPGGLAYVETPTSAWHAGGSPSSRARSLLNDRLGIKIGHPFPPAGRTAKLFRRDPRVRVEEIEGRPNHDHMLIWKLAPAT